MQWEVQPRDQGDVPDDALKFDGLPETPPFRPETAVHHRARLTRERPGESLPEVQTGPSQKAEPTKQSNECKDFHNARWAS